MKYTCGGRETDRATRINDPRPTAGDPQPDGRAGRSLQVALAIESQHPGSRLAQRNDLVLCKAAPFGEVHRFNLTGRDGCRDRLALLG